jgi:hypothetical protein
MILESDSNRELCLFLARPRKTFEAFSSSKALSSFPASASGIFKYQYGPIQVLEQDFLIDRGTLTKIWPEFAKAVIELFRSLEPEFIWITDEIGEPIPPQSPDFDPSAKFAALWDDRRNTLWISDTLDQACFRDWNSFVMKQ